MVSSPLSTAEGSLGERQGLIKYAQVRVCPLRPGKEEKVSAVIGAAMPLPRPHGGIKSKLQRKKGTAKPGLTLGTPGCLRPPRRVPFCCTGPLKNDDG